MDFGSQSFGLANQQQFLYMDFETIEILLVCYIGNWNMMIFKKITQVTSLKRLTSYDLQNFFYGL